MSSNSSISGGNGGSSNSGGRGGRKQQKRIKVPKRGPGVAELEKILREQEMEERAEKAGDEGYSVPSFMSNLQNPYNSPPLRCHPAPPTPPQRPPFLPPSMATASGGRTAMPSVEANPLPAHRPLGPRFDKISQSPQTSMPAAYGNGGGYGRNVGAAAVGGPGLVLPEQAFPMRRTQCPPSMIWSNAPPSSVSLSTGLHNHHAEFPSNQSSYYASRVPEEHKMAGMKRPHPLSLDNSVVPSVPLQVPPIYPQFSLPNQSSTNYNHTASLFNPSDEINRDANWVGPLEPNSRRFNSENEVLPHPNLSAFGNTPSVPSPMHLFQREIPNCNVLSYQVTQEQRSESNGEDHKPFYNFLKEEEPMGTKETKLSSIHAGSDEVGTNGIDLRLKLG